MALSLIFDTKLPTDDANKENISPTLSYTNIRSTQTIDRLPFSDLTEVFYPPQREEV